MPGCVSEKLYATFLAALSRALWAERLVLQVDVGETFPVQDIYEDAMDMYFDAVAPGGELTITNPTYRGDLNGRAVMTIQQMAGHAAGIDTMFGIAFEDAHVGRIHQNFSWNTTGFAAFLPWVAAQGICKVGSTRRTEAIKARAAGPGMWPLGRWRASLRSLRRRRMPIAPGAALLI